MNKSILNHFHFLKLILEDNNSTKEYINCWVIIKNKEYTNYCYNNLIYNTDIINSPILENEIIIPNVKLNILKELKEKINDKKLFNINEHLNIDLLMLLKYNKEWHIDVWEKYDFRDIINKKYNKNSSSKKINNDSILKIVKKIWYISNRKFINSYYKKITIPKKNNKVREINVPNYKLKQIQKNISNNIFEPYFNELKSNKNNWYIEKSIFWYIKWKSTKDMCLKHINSYWFIKLDISDFFWSINKERIVWILKKIYPISNIYKSLNNIEIVNNHSSDSIVNLNHNDKLNNIKTNINFISHKNYINYYNYLHLLSWLLVNDNNQLSQWSPASPVISNIIWTYIDKDITKYINNLEKKINIINKNNKIKWSSNNSNKKIKIIYTRYVDDISISINDKYFFNKYYNKIILKIKEIIEDNWFLLNENKIWVFRTGNKKKLTGIVFSNEDKKSETLSIDKQYITKLQNIEYSIKKNWFSYTMIYYYIDLFFEQYLYIDDNFKWKYKIIKEFIYTLQNELNSNKSVEINTINNNSIIWTNIKIEPSFYINKKDFKKIIFKIFNNIMLQNNYFISKNNQLLKNHMLALLNFVLNEENISKFKAELKWKYLYCLNINKEKYINKLDFSIFD